MTMFASEDETPTAIAHDKIVNKRLKNIRSALSKVGQTEEGRLVLWHILFDVCKINEDAFGGEEIVYRHMGRRSAGLQILTEIEEADVAIHLNMIKDNRNRTVNESLILQQLIDEETAKEEES